MEQRPAKPPTPGSWRPGQSGNPRGRPRRGDALAEAIREHVDPRALIAVAASILRDERAPASVRIQAASFLAERGYSRPSERLELVAGVADEDLDLSRLSDEHLAELDALERRRAEILASADRDVLPQRTDEES